MPEASHSSIQSGRPTRFGSRHARHSRARHWLIPALSLPLLSALLSCSTDHREAPARVVLVTLDTLNVRFTGPYNPEVTYTPTLDRFAEEGTLFERAHTPVTITLPAHASLFSGRSPENIGVMLNNHALAEEVETLPEILLENGYRTAGFVSLGVLERAFGLDQGFSHYDDQRFRRLGRWYLNAEEVVSAASEWVLENREEPFFLWLHLSDPHEPYLEVGADPDTRIDLDGEPLGEWSLTAKQHHELRFELPPGRHRLRWTSVREPRPDDEWETTLWLRLASTADLSELYSGPAGRLNGEIDLRRPFVLELENAGGAPTTVEIGFRGRLAEPPPSEVFERYPKEVEYLDHHLGQLLELFETEGLDRDTLWLLVSDHGEGMFNHRILGHSDFAQEDQLRILWVLRGPGVPAGLRVAEPGRLIQDVAPTALELLGLPGLEATDGVSQTSCWQRSGCPRREEWWTFGASLETNQVTAVGAVRWPYKILWQLDPGSGCYEIAADPWEQENLCKLYTEDPSLMPVEIRELDAQLSDQRSRLSRALAEIIPLDTDPEREELLRSLGYLGQ